MILHVGQPGVEAEMDKDKHGLRMEDNDDRQAP